MRINVPPRYRRGFWLLAPRGRICWLMKDRLPDVGEELQFTMDRKVVATAACSMLSREGRQTWWRVCWSADTFEDVRDDDAEGFKPRLYGGYGGRPEAPRAAGPRAHPGQARAGHGRRRLPPGAP
jgi:hypothetical protein